MKPSTAYLLKSLSLDNGERLDFAYDEYNLKTITLSDGFDSDIFFVETEIYENQIKLICIHEGDKRTYIYEFDEEDELEYFKDEEKNRWYAYGKNRQDTADILSQMLFVYFGNTVTFEYEPNMDQQMVLNGFDSSGEEDALVVINESEENLLMSIADDWDDWEEGECWEYEFEKIKMPARTSELLKSSYSKAYYHMFDWFTMVNDFY